MLVNTFIRRSKWLSNSTTLYFSESVEFKEGFLRFLVKIFKIAGSV